MVSTTTMTTTKEATARQPTFIALIADAGFATRFLPASRVVPKGLMPLGSFPLILYLLKELTHTPVKKVYLVTSSRMKKIYSRFFEEDQVLINYLESKNKLHLIQEYRQIINSFDITILIQSNKYPAGTGAPILTLADYLKANDKLDYDYMFYLFADDVLLPSDTQRDVLFLQEITRLILQPDPSYQQTEPIGAVLGTQITPRKFLNKYGIVKPKSQITSNLVVVDTVVEKPPIEQAPSNLAQFGRLLFHKQFESYLRDFLKAMDTPEFWIQPAITQMAKSYTVLAYSNPAYSWLTTGDPYNMANAWAHWQKIYAD